MLGIFQHTVVLYDNADFWANFYTSSRHLQGSNNLKYILQKSHNWIWDIVTVLNRQQLDFVIYLFEINLI